MTKANMIENIQQKEAELWLELATYDYHNAPDTGDIDEQIYWEHNDPGHCTKLYAWCAVHDLMESLGIETDYSSAEHNVAADLSHDLFIRRQAARGIHYDEQGNEISA